MQFFTPASTYGEGTTQKSLEIHKKIQECDDKMEMFWFSALDIQNLTDRLSDASCFLCLTLASLTHGRAGPSELVPYVWNSR